jgi:porin
VDETPRLQVQARYVGDLLWNANGGLQIGTAWLDYAEIALAWDAGRVLELGRLAFFASAGRSNSTTFSDRYPGDDMVVSNIETARSPGLVQAWMDWGFNAAGPGSLRFGFYDLNSDFDTAPSRGLFLNSAYGIGHEISQTGRNGPSIFPATAMALRLAWSPAPRWLVRAAVIDAVPGDPGFTGRSRWHVSQSEGLLYVAEATRETHSNWLMSLGHWRYSEPAPALQPTNADHSTEQPNYGSYVSAEFGPRPGHRGPAWRAFLRAGLANDEVNAYGDHVGLGVVLDTGALGLPGSSLGIAASQARLGAAGRRLRGNRGTGRDPYERNIELTWRLPVGSHFVLQPDLQYIVNPGIAPGISDALVFGLRAELAVSN